MSGQDTLLEIRDLHAGIDGNEILKGIDLKMGPGEIHAIMGRNGSGKTTTANVIMGHPDSVSYTHLTLPTKQMV